MSVLVVTGGSRGIGAEICRLAAGRGWSVCVNYDRNAEAAQSVASEIERVGGRVISAQADIGDPEQVTSLFEKVDRDLGLVAGLVNNAAIMGSSGRVEELKTDRTRRMLEVNVLGTFLCCQAAIKRMAKRYGGSGGAIVNISSARRRVMAAPAAMSTSLLQRQQSMC